MATEYNGGFQSYADKSTKDIFFRAEDRATKTVTLLGGQVVKALTPLETDSAGRAKVFTGMVAEAALLTFGASGTAAQTSIITASAGNLVTFTVGTGKTVTPAQLVTAWVDYYNNNGTASSAIDYGSFAVTGTGITGYRLEKHDSDTLAIIATTFASDIATNVTATGTVASQTLNVTNYAASTTKLIGFAVYDVAALASDGSTSLDTEIAVYSDASFWADALVWAADSTDTITWTDGSTKSCTAFNTGADGRGMEGYPASISKAAAVDLRNRRNKLVEGTEFTGLGHRLPGDYY